MPRWLKVVGMLFGAVIASRTLGDMAGKMVYDSVLGQHGLGIDPVTQLLDANKASRDVAGIVSLVGMGVGIWLVVRWYKRDKLRELARRIAAAEWLHAYQARRESIYINQATPQPPVTVVKPPTEQPASAQPAALAPSSPPADEQSTVDTPIAKRDRPVPRNKQHRNRPSVVVIPPTDQTASAQPTTLAPSSPPADEQSTVDSPIAKRRRPVPRVPDGHVPAWRPRRRLTNPPPSPKS